MKKLIPILLAVSLMAIGMVGCTKDPVVDNETTTDSVADTTDTAPESETDATTESDVTLAESNTVTEAVEDTTGETETAE